MSKKSMISIFIILSAISLAACSKKEELVQASAVQGFDLSLKEMSDLSAKAEQGDGEAAYRIALYYDLGAGSDPNKAMKWYESGAKNGHLKSQKSLITALVNSKEPAKLKEAVSWLIKLAEKGDAQSLKGLAVAYEKGAGVTKDFMRSRYYYEEASFKGDRLSAWNLIYYYTQGIGGSENIPLATAWLRLYMYIFKPGVSDINSINCMLRGILISENIIFIVTQMEYASRDEYKELEHAYKSRALSNKLVLGPEDIANSENEYRTLFKTLTDNGTIAKWQKEKQALDSAPAPDAQNLPADCPSYS